MNTITAIRDSKRGKRQVNVLLDGKLAFSLEADVAAKECLQVGQELSAEQIAALSRSNMLQRCRGTALRYLSYRPRSESEMRERLHQRSFDGSTIETTIARLKDEGLVDDVAFARFWKDNRQTFRPRSRWLTGSELRRKGVSGDIIDQTVAKIDDDESAYQTVLSKVRGLPQSDYDGFRRRLGAYLQRRGFSYEVVSRTVERVWQERENSH